MLSDASAYSHLSEAAVLSVEENIALNHSGSRPCQIIALLATKKRHALKDNL